MDKKHIISDIFMIIVIIITILIYRKYSYNFYSKGIAEGGKTSFSRDSKETTNKGRSYKVENKDYNDAMFYRKISVKKDTPYMVSCMVKTQDVQQYNNAQTAGVQIALKGTEEHSKILSGTNDWTKLEFCFNSKDNDTVEIGFRLGGNGEKAKGTAYFSDLSIEEGALDNTSKWNFACFIFNNINVKLDNGQVVKESLTNSENYEFRDMMGRFKDSCSVLCKNKMQVTDNIIDINDPITTFSYDDTNGYYIGESDVYNLIEKYLDQGEYDHIFVCAKMPSETAMANKKVTDWIGLGNMEYCGKGFSNIKLLDNQDNYYTYSTNHEFPEEVYIHEFLHTLERNSGEYGYSVPALHSNEQHGYKEDKTEGLKQWYADYMNKQIKDGNTYIGLPEEIYKYKPVQPSDFKYFIKLNSLDEPKNIIETIQSIFSQVSNLFRKADNGKEITLIS